ncbi:hypothetical protein FQN60_012283 [Etheostoma spectabile]|uniref:Uncharacterized protein n=1 Tax=Etheostoma spectabile TaxID=54343 RepID=A0A5J5DPM2_9PERO|nr:hypothetical protein FQN60_012283 [Etheostoma spectabile]
MPPRTPSWSGSLPVIIPSDPPSPVLCSEQKERWRISEFTRRRLSFLLLDVAVDRPAAPLGMMHHGTDGFGGRNCSTSLPNEMLFTPICYIKAGPNSTC